MLEVITMWNSTNSLYDLDASGTVDVSDLLRVLGDFGI